MSSEVTGLDPEDTSAEGNPRAYIIFYADGTKAGLITGGTVAMIVGDEGTVAGLVLCASGVGAMEGAAVAGASVAVSAVGETATVGGAALMASTAINSEGGYNRGGEKVSGKNERHGDGGRAEF